MRPVRTRQPAGPPLLRRMRQRAVACPGCGFSNEAAEKFCGGRYAIVAESDLREGGTKLTTRLQRVVSVR